jgi:hypothetical protein
MALRMRTLTIRGPGVVAHRRVAARHLDGVGASTDSRCTAVVLDYDRLFEAGVAQERVDGRVYLMPAIEGEYSRIDRDRSTAWHTIIPITGIHTGTRTARMSPARCPAGRWARPSR